MIKKTLLLFVFFSFFYSLSAQDAIDSVITKYMNSHKIPGLVIALQKGEDLIKLSEYGFADVQNGSKVEKHTTFELGSLSKQFTAAAILKLQQDGRLNIEDHLEQHFPDCPNHWKEIKIKHLFWHTSGLPGMFQHDRFTRKSFTGYSRMNLSELDTMMQTNMVTKELAIKSILTDSLDFTPGSMYNYSDVGYLVLGILIDNITGSYHDYMVDEIFKPFEMNNTYLLNQEKVVLDQARGYSLKNGELINIMRTWDYEIPSFFGIFSNVDDLIKWNHTLDKDEFLNKESKSIIFSKGKLNDGSEIEYGGGWEINNINGIKFISHNGVTGTRMVKIPSSNWCLILLTNLGYNGNDMVDPWSLSNEILRELNIETNINRNHITSDQHTVIKFSKKEFKKIEGDYTTADGLTAKVCMHESIAIFESQNSKNEIALLDNNSWLVLGLEYEYVLTYDEKNGLIISNYGREFIKQ